MPNSKVSDPDGPWLLMDVDFPLPAFRRLREKGVQALHAGEEGLAGLTDRELLEYARRDGCLVVTRDFASYGRLAEAYAARGREFPGILLLSPELRPADAEGHVRAVEGWLSRVAGWSDEELRRSVGGRYVWLA